MSTVTIEQKYRELGGRNSLLRAPVDEERSCPDRVGRFRRFEQGVIYWHPATGAHEVHGAINTKWAELGGERSFLGYPTSDELGAGYGQGRCGCFQGGRIYWSPETGVWSTDLHSDKAVLDWMAFNAKPLPADWLAQFKDFDLLPVKLDYSADINFARNQGISTAGGWGGYGCPLYAFLHIIDILKEWEHPYTPALSWRYAEWYMIMKGGASRIDNAELGDHGCASEGLCHSNWDTDVQLLPDYPQWDKPSQAAEDEASLYRVKTRPNNGRIAAKAGTPSPSIEEIKQLLRAYGPLWCGGKGHAKAIVGYDDDQESFTILDSYPHTETGGHNITHLAYSEVGPGGAIDTFSEVENIPTEKRVMGQYAYSARIRIENNWRGTYTISIGVEGKTPLVVWTTRGRDTKTSPVPLEPHRYLAIDVPLPDYAAAYWPPTSTHRWFLRVEDHDRDGATGTITEFTLARRYIHPDCHTLGKYRTETYGGPISVIVPDPASGPTVPAPGPTGPFAPANATSGIATVYVPANAGIGGGTVQIVKRYSISLTDYVLPSEVGNIAMAGQLMMTVPVSSPAANQKVQLFKLNLHACVNKPSQWIPRGTTITDASGKFKFEVAAQPALHKQVYAAAFSDAQGRLLASSEYMVIEYRLDQLPVLMKVKLPEIRFPDLALPDIPMQDHVIPTIPEMANGPS